MCSLFAVSTISVSNQCFEHIQSYDDCFCIVTGTTYASVKPVMKSVRQEALADSLLSNVPLVLQAMAHKGKATVGQEKISSLSVCLSVCLSLSICLCRSLFFCLHVSLSAPLLSVSLRSLSLSFPISPSLSVSLSLFLWVCNSVSLFTWLCLTVCLSLNILSSLSLSQFFCLCAYLCLSVYFSSLSCLSVCLSVSLSRNAVFEAFKHGMCFMAALTVVFCRLSNVDSL